MNLSDYEKRMLEGGYGEGIAEAMKLQVAIGKAFDAERMVEVSRVHVSLAHMDSDIWYTQKLLAGGARCRISPTCNPIYDLDYLERAGFSDPAGEKVLLDSVRDTFAKLKIIPTYSCTPGLQSNVPRFGEYVAFAESSATVYVNAVCGARTNRESAKSALAAAITGRAPLYGYMLDRNRLGNVLVNVEATIKDDFDYHLLGYAAAQKMGVGVPVFQGMPRRPSPEELVSLSAQLATGGSVAMFHIIGVTPEASDLESAFGGHSPQKIMTISDDDLSSVQSKLSRKSGKIDFVMFGCPHYSIDQIGAVAKQLEGKIIHKDVEFWILTSSFTREMAEKMGYLDVIYKAGGHVVAGTCADISCWHKIYAGKIGVTDSVKAAYYTPRVGMDFQLERRSRCVEIAVKGGF
jgi:predicted aconitase